MQIFPKGKLYDEPKYYVDDVEFYDYCRLGEKICYNKIQLGDEDERIGTKIYTIDSKLMFEF